MIFVERIEAITKYCQDNRLDKGSKSPYFRATEIDGGYSLPEDVLIVDGLKELSIPFTGSINYLGIDIEVESKYLNK